MEQKYTLPEQLERIKEKVSDIILLGYGGSYAYGTNVETSDIDLRGIYRNPVEELIGIRPDSEQYEDSDADTIVYSLRKVIKLLYDCNPNVIELLGLRPQDYHIVTEEGKLLIDNAPIFLSKKAIYTFGGYAKSQLNRLVNRSGRGREEIVQNETRSIEKVLDGIKYRHREIDRDSFCVRTDGDNIFLNMSFRDMPIVQVLNLMNEINVVHKDYKKSVRNDKAILHEKLNKHATHLIRLFQLGTDILNLHEIRTYREGADHDLLMRIRAGEYLKEDGITPTKEFEELIREYEAKFQEAAETTTLPDEPDYEKINEMVMRINRMR